MRSDETHVKFRRGGSACEWNSLEPDGSRAVRIALMFPGSVDMPKPSKAASTSLAAKGLAATLIGPPLDTERQAA